MKKAEHKSKEKVMKILRLVCAMFVLGLVGVSAANADPGNGAVVERDPYGTPWTCIITDTAGNFWTFECTIQTVTTPNGDVKEYLRGPITGGDPLPSKAVTDVTTEDTGLLCDFVDGVITEIVKGTVTPSGNVKLTCRG